MQHTVPRGALRGVMVCACVIGIATLASCAPKVAVSEADDIAPATESSASVETAATGEEELDRIYATMDEMQKRNAPQVLTLDDGTRIQRTPNDTSFFQLYDAGDLSYNTKYLKADNRGCNSCHADLSQTLANMDFLHLEVDNGYGTTVSVEDCRICHDLGRGYVDKTQQLGSLIHGVHSEVADASCMSCHNGTSDGLGMQLWEDVRYSVMQGITALPSDKVAGEFSYEQETTSDMFSASWFYGATNQENIAKQRAGEDLDPSVFDAWEVSVSGLVERPFAMSLNDLIAEAPSKTLTSTLGCIMNPAGGEQIANCEITGIPISWLLDKAGIKDGATAIMSTAPDGWSRGSSLENYRTYDGYLVYEINGERLDWDKGYPVVSWWPGQAIPASIRWVSELEVVDTPLTELKSWQGWTTNSAGDGMTEYNGGHYYAAVESGEEATFINKPNAGILHFKEGQIVDAGKPYTFEGYAYAFDEQIVSVEFSLDQGETWTAFDTSDSDLTKWVYWNFTVTPEPGAYVLSVRATTDKGKVSYTPDAVFFNAQ